MRYHFSPQSEWPSFKSLQITNAGEGGEKGNLPIIDGENVSWCSHCGKQIWRFRRKLKVELSCDPAIPLWDIYVDKTLI